MTAVGIAGIDIPLSRIIIYAFDQNPAGLDEGNEWVTILNPNNKSVNIGNWTLETTNGSTVSIWIAEGTTLYPGAYITFSPSYRWIDNNNESIILRDAVGEVVDRTPVVSDNECDNEEAKEFLNETCMWEEVKLDVDDKKQYDSYYRILAVVYVNETNLNEKMVREGYAEVKYTAF
ncbi:hypothetical protein C5S29_12200 [ANME-1 cluster archaeon GoMg3.2]|nr:hypothetical protein [ANME-1 cluster archaeon GoMg3.2]